MEGQTSDNGPRNRSSFVRTNYSGESLFEIFSSGNLNIQTFEGKSESHRSRKDSKGNHVTIVTRKLGGQSHTATTKVDANGVEEHTENFFNINGTVDLSNFNERWETGIVTMDNKATETEVPAPNPKFWLQTDIPKFLILGSLLVCLILMYGDVWYYY